jgi:hypothetical protein
MAPQIGAISVLPSPIYYCLTYGDCIIKQHALVVFWGLLQEYRAYPQLPAIHFVLRETCRERSVELFQRFYQLPISM